MTRTCLRRQIDMSKNNKVNYDCWICDDRGYNLERSYEPDIPHQRVPCICRNKTISNHEYKEKQTQDRNENKKGS